MFDVVVQQNGKTRKSITFAPKDKREVVSPNVKLARSHSFTVADLSIWNAGSDIKNIDPSKSMTIAKDSKIHVSDYYDSSNYITVSRPLSAVSPTLSTSQ